jgi:outer membrane protein OmpA-like peptidoglycan-associated protein
LRGGKHPEVEIYNLPGRSFKGKLIYSQGDDPQNLAILEVRGIPPDIVAVKLSRSDQAMEGDRVEMIGFPLYSDAGWVVIYGDILVLKGRYLIFSSLSDGFVAGSPLIKDGAVIGLVTESRKATSLAISAQMIRLVLKESGVLSEDALLSLPKDLDLGPVYYFNFQETQLHGSSTRLEEALYALKYYQDLRVLIEGHSDSTERNPLELSRKRAESIRNYMVKFGMSSRRFEVAALGNGRPARDNSTDEGRAMNRRVELKILK